MRSSLALLALAALRGAAALTCEQKAAAGSTEACVVTTALPASTQVGGYPLPSGWAGPAPVCYTQYYMNQLATPTFMPRNSICSAYANRGCCNSETVMSIDNEQYGTASVYPGYSSRCGPLSPACLSYFQMEACFYECDHNIGKYRKYPTCLDSAGEQNGWQIAAMPLDAGMVNGWYAACANDLFCTGDSGSYFDLPSLTCVKPVAPANETATCRKFSNIYPSAQAMITKMWDGSFSVAAPGAPGFVFPAPGAAPFVGPNDNPNNGVATALNVSVPPFCPFRTAVNGTAQALADLALYISNEGKYADAVYMGALYDKNVTPAVDWFGSGLPLNRTASFSVTASVALSGLTVAAFNATAQGAFIAAVATTANVFTNAVAITSIAATSASGRHLLQSSVTVAFAVASPSAALAASVSTAVAAATSGAGGAAFVATLNDALATAGSSATVTAVTVVAQPRVVAPSSAAPRRTAALAAALAAAAAALLLA